MVVGYARTSTEEQHLDREINAIKEYCKSCNIILNEMFADKQSGKDFERPDYKMMKRMLKNPGDIIIISELDRLGRNKEETLKELQHYKSKGVSVRILELPTTLTDYSTMDDTMAKMILETINNMLIEMYATLAHAEMMKREKRQKEGMDAKRERGEWDGVGRPQVIKNDEFAEFCNNYLSLCLRYKRRTDIMEHIAVKVKDKKDNILYEPIRKTTFYKYRKLCIERYFPSYYTMVTRGEMTEAECMIKLGIGPDEYKGYVLSCLPESTTSTEAIKPEAPQISLPVETGLGLVHPSPIQELSPHYSQLSYTDFHQRYANLTRGISENYNPTLKERAGIMGISIPKFEEHRKVYITEKFITLYQDVERGIITAGDCMAKLGLSQEEYSDLLNEYEITYGSAETYPSYTNSSATCSILPNQAQALPQTQPSPSTPSTEQAAQKSFIAAAFSTEPSQDNKQILNDDSDAGMHTTDEAAKVREYIDGLRGKMQWLIEAQVVLGLDEEAIKYLSQNSNNLALYYEFPLSEIQQSASETERYVDNLIARLESLEV